MSQQNATGGAITNSLISFYGEAKPQFSTIIFYNHRGILPMNVYKSLGLVEELAVELAQHVEAGWIHPNFHAYAAASAAQGANLTYRIALEDVVNDTVYPRVTDTLLFNDGTAGSIVTKTHVGLNNWTIEVQPYNTSFTLAVSTGEACWIIGNSQAEGTGQPTARDTGREVLQYPVQIVKETWQGTGTALTDELWQKSDQFGQMRDTYNSGYLDAEYRFVEQIGNIATFGPVNANTGNSDTNMYSIDYVVDTQGNDTPYVSGTYGINELKENIRYANKLQSGWKFLFLQGPEMELSCTTGLSDVFSQNPNLFGTIGRSEFSDNFVKGVEDTASALGVSIDFKKIKYGNYSFHLTPVPQWGTAVSGGADGYLQTGYGYLIPLTLAQDANGTLQDRFKMTYKNLGRFNRAMKIWETGANAQNPTNDVDNLQLNFLGHWGTSFMGAQHFQRVLPSN
jgi:hypothetical protein